MLFRSRAAEGQVDRAGVSDSVEVAVSDRERGADGTVGEEGVAAVERAVRRQHRRAGGTAKNLRDASRGVAHISAADGVAMGGVEDEIFDAPIAWQADGAVGGNYATEGGSVLIAGSVAQAGNIGGRPVSRCAPVAAIIEIPSRAGSEEC